MAFVSPLQFSFKPSHYARSFCSAFRPQFATGFSAHRPFVSMNVQVPTAYKDALLEKVSSLNFGRKIADSPKAQKEVEELARQVEATNKSSNPAADPNLSAKWNMVYTTSTSILRIAFPKFLQPYKISQFIDAKNLRAKNEEVFKLGPFKFTNAVEAKLTPLSQSNFFVKFVRFIIFGFIKINVEKRERFKGSLEVTYLDEDLRISRGNKGNLFILVKDKTVKYP